MRYNYSQAYKRGYDESIQGKHLHNNPYPVNTEKNREWNKGWLKANQEYIASLRHCIIRWL